MKKQVSSALSQQKRVETKQQPRWDPPQWYVNRSGASTQHVIHSVSAWLSVLRSGRLRLPAFQRQWVWSDEQIVRFIDSIVNGYHLNSMILWMQHDLSPKRARFGELEFDAPACSWGWLVVDGQQRLGALATASVAERFKFNVKDGTVCVHHGDAPWLVPCSLIMTDAGLLRVLDGWASEHAHRHDIDVDDVKSGIVHAAKIVSNSFALGAVELSSAWNIDRVVESFKRINSEGVPVDPEHMRSILLDELR